MCGLCRGAAWCLLRVALHVARWVPPVACQIRCDDASACGVAPRRAAHATASKRAARATLHRAECGKRFLQRVRNGSLHHGAIHGTVANQQHGCAHSEQCKQLTSSVATHTNHNVQCAARARYSAQRATRADLMRMPCMFLMSSVSTSWTSACWSVWQIHKHRWLPFGCGTHRSTSRPNVRQHGQGAREATHSSTTLFTAVHRHVRSEAERKSLARIERADLESPSGDA